MSLRSALIHLKVAGAPSTVDESIEDELSTVGGAVGAPADEGEDTAKLEDGVAEEVRIAA